MTRTVSPTANSGAFAASVTPTGGTKGKCEAEGQGAGIAGWVPYLAEQGAQDHGSDTGERHTGQTRPSVGAAGEGGEEVVFIGEIRV
jgi:hypothetical protein